MFKYFIFLLFTVNNVYAQEVSATQKLPEAVISGSAYVVETIISKRIAIDFMKFLQDVPAGCIATTIESKGGDFNFADGAAKIVWLTPPVDSQFTVSYRVSVPKGIIGIKNINGKLAYLQNNERQIYTLETKTIKIGDTAVTAAISASVSETKKEEQVALPISNSEVIAKDTSASQITIANDSKKEEPLPLSINQVISKDTVTTRIPIVDVKQQEVKSIPIDKPEKEEKAPTTEDSVSTEKPVIGLSISNKVSVTTIPLLVGRTFRVQIGAFNLKPKIKGVPDLSTVVLDNGMTKYFSGDFTTHEEALRRKKEMIEKGFKGAFIVLFENGKILK